MTQKLPKLHHCVFGAFMYFKCLLLIFTDRNRGIEMLGKILSHLLGNAEEEDCEAADETYKELMEFEEGGWVIVNLPGERQIPCSR